ncbi:hypothetical protein WAX46_14000 [Bacillus sp. FJAT-53060]|uniref:hypothetical protein n=1 Tax=Bacillus sp. FJAT-53060 TaxID=3127666 RepID=UPI003013EFEF
MDGRRIQETHQSVDPADLRKSTPELMLYSTWSLILLLKEARKIRTPLYKEFAYVRSKSRGLRDKEKAEDIAAEFQDITKRMYIIENILKKRLSSVPDNLNVSYLSRYEKRMNNKKTNQKMHTYGQESSRRETD